VDRSGLLLTRHRREEPLWKRIAWSLGLKTPGEQVHTALPHLFALLRPGDWLLAFSDMSARRGIVVRRNQDLWLAVGALCRPLPLNIAVEEPEGDHESGFVHIVDSGARNRLRVGDSLVVGGAKEVRLYVCSQVMIPSRRISLSVADRAAPREAVAALAQSLDRIQ
jgi:hypothetical protein